jgi:signal transduction histidine kinase
VREVKIVQSVWTYFGLSRQKFKSDVEFLQARIAFSFFIVYALAWLFYVPLYLWLGNRLAALFCVSLGFTSAIYGAYVISKKQLVGRGGIWANLGGCLTLVAIAAVTGGLYSPIIGWLFFGTATTFLCHGRSLGLIIVSMSWVGILLVDILHALGWLRSFSFPFTIESTPYHIFIILVHCTIIPALGLVTGLFENLMRNAFLQAQRSLDEVNEKNAQIELLTAKLAAENISIHKRMRHEVESRFEVASSIAHQLNNPLNYIATSSHQLRDSLSNVRSDVLTLFEGDSSIETRQAQKFFEKKFDDLFAIFDNIDLGVKRSDRAIKEIRDLSGIDGYPIELLSFNKLVPAVQERLKEHITKEDSDRLEFSQTLAGQHLVFGNTNLFKNALVIVLRHVLEHSRDKLTIEFANDNLLKILTVHLVGRFHVEKQQMDDVLDKVSHLLRSTHTCVNSAVSNEKILITFCVTGDF